MAFSSGIKKRLTKIVPREELHTDKESTSDALTTLRAPLSITTDVSMDMPLLETLTDRSSTRRRLCKNQSPICCFATSTRKRPQIRLRAADEHVIFAGSG